MPARAGGVYLFRNLGRGRFEDVTEKAGLANKSGTFEEIASATGLATVTNKYLGWACGLTHFENSGIQDFWTANGHVYPSDKDYLQPIVIFRGSGAKTEIAFSYPATLDSSYRGGAVGDFDNDGSMDLVVLPVSGTPVLLQNKTPGSANWVGLALRGTRCNGDAIGATVTVEACGQTQSDSLRNGGSYISRNDPRLHFGLGACSKLDRVTVMWPDGTKQEAKGVRLNTYNTVQQTP